jgi:hypothetical protein
MPTPTPKGGALLSRALDRLQHQLTRSHPTPPPSPSPRSFGGVSPERKAGEVLRTFFTFCAVKIIMAQMQGSGRGSLGAYNAEGYARLAAFLEAQPLRNGDEWVARLMEADEMLGERRCWVQRPGLGLMRRVNSATLCASAQRSAAFFDCARAQQGDCAPGFPRRASTSLNVGPFARFAEV